MSKSWDYPYEQRGKRAEPDSSVLLGAVQRMRWGRRAPASSEPMSPSTRLARPPDPVPEQPPRWVSVLQRRNASVEEVLNEMERRVRSKRHESVLVEALAILNELGRLPESEAVIRARITQAVVDELIEERG